MLYSSEDPDKEPGKYTVFVVDDNADDRLQALKTLQKSPYVYNAHCFENGDKLMEHLVAEGFYANSIIRNMPLLIILDMNMPGTTNGMQILRGLREHAMTKNIPIIMLTNDTSGARMLEAHHLSANAYIPKPLRLASLHEVIVSGSGWTQRPLGHAL
jgi:CheY-like chemotaxis protein